MPDLIEPPPRTRPRLPHAFTQDNAREMAYRSIEARKARIAKAKRTSLEISLSSPNERLVLLEEQITRTRDTLNGKLEPQHRAALLRALCELLDQQRIARGEPLPGSRKPAPERRQSASDTTLAPVPIPIPTEPPKPPGA